MRTLGKVIAGRYEEYNVLDLDSGISIDKFGTNDYRLLSKCELAWSLFQAEDTTSTSYSFWKGMAGAVLFGPFGLIAGTGGKKTGKKTYLIEVIWNETQERSLLEFDEKGYKTFLRYMY